MKINKNIRIIAIITLLFFSVEIFFFTPNVYAQSVNRIEDKIGGSGSTTNQDDSKSSNTFLYIAAGVIVVGLIVWKVLLDKKEPKTKEEVKTDSTKTSLNSHFYKDLSPKDLHYDKIQNRIPIELYLGLKNDDQLVGKSNLVFGLRFKL